MKHEWRKKEKVVYLPKNQPEKINVPTYQFITLEGEGNPNGPFFKQCLETLYPLCYGIKMTLKKNSVKPKDYVDYTVYPLEGIWDINDEAKKIFTGKINKDDLVFKLMIRQPDFVTADFFQQIFEQTKIKKPHLLLDRVRFEKISDGDNIQMMHLGSYDNEAESFERMEAFAKNEGLIRVSKIHREIYISDFRKVAPEKLKTVLRFQVRKY